MNWKHVGTVYDGQPFNLNGVNIWDFKWHDTGTEITVKDPLYNQDHRMTVYEIRDQEITIQFAAGEFSNCVWGIYQGN